MRDVNHPRLSVLKHKFDHHLLLRYDSLLYVFTLVPILEKSTDVCHLVGVAIGSKVSWAEMIPSR